MLSGVSTSHPGGIKKGNLMSYEAQAWAVKKDIPCTPKMVLMMLANRINKDTGQCFPSISILALDCGLSKRSVINQLEKLENLKLIKIIRRKIDKVKVKNLYSLDLFDHENVVKEIQYPSERDSLEVVQEVHQGSERGALEVVNEVHPNQEVEPVREPREGDFIPKRVTFVKPSLQEIQKFISEKNLNVDTETFFDYYEANGWKAGKNPMRNWEATLRNWDRREKKRNEANKRNSESKAAAVNRRLQEIATADREARQGLDSSNIREISGEVFPALDKLNPWD